MFGSGTAACGLLWSVVFEIFSDFKVSGGIGERLSSVPGDMPDWKEHEPWARCRLGLEEVIPTFLVYEFIPRGTISS